jgi:hypothetical protein
MRIRQLGGALQVKTRDKFLTGTIFSLMSMPLGS